MSDPTRRSSSPARVPVVARPKRQKIDVACDVCRSRKVKCDGKRPGQIVSNFPSACGNCLRRSDLNCNYTPASSERTPRPHPYQSPIPRARLASRTTGTPSSSLSHLPVEHSPAGIDSMTIVLEDGESTQQYFGSSSAGSFTRQIRAAIDARLGVPVERTAGGISSTPSLQAARSQDSGPLDYTLPPRRTADKLMDTYWHYVDPLYPFLDREQWMHAYQGIFAGTPINTDERIFVTTLNVIFALSTQLIESLQPDHRDDSSSEYFRKAQGLLRLNPWDSGPLELVQCLLLMSQYLQSANNPHPTWMVVGSAVRTAQSLGLHLPETSADVASSQEREFLRRLWHGCVLMDRMVSLTHGRPAMISNQLASAVPLPLYSSDSRTAGPTGATTSGSPRVAFFAKSVELYEIINRISLAFYSGGRSGGSDRSSTSSSEGADEDLGTVIRLDESLGEWERNLPRHLDIQALDQVDDEIIKRQGVVLRMRFLQARLLLLRPVLSRFCLEPTGPNNPPPKADTLRGRVVRECASFCVVTAQDLISALAEHQPQDGAQNLLPAWWYRIYYVYTASIVLVVAKLRPDIFDVRKSWDQAMAILHNHEKFGPPARRCIAVLNILSDKIMQGGQSNGNGAPAGQELDQTVDEGNLDVDGFLTDDIDLDGFSFNADGLTWFNTHAWEVLTMA
ncbi:related to C6 transcription factor [Cephalotrichum gorgonifer]|uniref:Related to C6 transcription factor n=1 Tax=Cephalotrichum gorgonifer TaxID=2041049 RepID=A0AAE8SYW7_9PEZI|nr:related to C6 transcription factor [Cephalotrichum gorgonifer]